LFYLTGRLLAAIAAYSLADYRAQHMCSQAAKWLMYVTAREEMDQLMRFLHGRQTDWKAFAVSPTRLLEAIGAIQPQLVVFDSTLADMQLLVRRARGRCGPGTIVTSDADTDKLGELLA
jgi:hypothetical protein